MQMIQPNHYNDTVFARDFFDNNESLQNMVNKLKTDCNSNLI